MLTTVGQLLVNEALPEDLRDYARQLDKKNVGNVLLDLAERKPDLYKEVAYKLMNIGHSAATSSGVSLSLADFTPGQRKKDYEKQLRAGIRQILSDKRISTEDKGKALVMFGQKMMPKIGPDILEHDSRKGNRLADIVKSGTKGSLTQFNTVTGIPLLFTDHKQNPIPIPVLHNSAEGLDPAEFYATTFGTRYGLLSTKLATAESGDFGKQLAKAAHRMIITERDCGVETGITVDGDDPQNIGTVLARATDGLKAGQVLHRSDLSKLKDKKITVRSPITCQAEGVCAKCAGIRERGTFPAIGDSLGLPAAQALSERLSQGALNVKHMSGVAGKKVYGFEDVERLFQMPKNYPGAARLSEVDGVIKSIKPSPAGGVHVMVGDKEHWAPDASTLRVKIGDRVEPGDALDEGILNAKEVAKYKGIGEARRRFVDDAMRVSNGNLNRRNAEVIARAIVSHVQVTDPDAYDGVIPGDTLAYDNLARRYNPREGSIVLTPNLAHGHYLERPVLHYSIGTKIDRPVAQTLKSQGVGNILVNKNPPSFEPKIERMMTYLSKDPDWMTRLHGYYLKDSLLDAVHKGLTSTERSTSFVPALSRGVDFGKTLETGGKY